MEHDEKFSETLQVAVVTSSTPPLAQGFIHTDVVDSRKYSVDVNRTPTQTACTDAHSVTQHILNRLITFHHANTRGSRAGRLRIAHLDVPKQLSSTCHVSFFAAPDSDHKHKFSLTHFTYLSDNLKNTHKIFGTRSILTLRSSTAEWRINTNPIYPKAIETEAIGPEDFEPRRIELDRNLGTDPYRIQERFLTNHNQNPITEDMDEFGKVGAEMLHPVTDAFRL